MTDRTPEKNKAKRMESSGTAGTDAQPAEKGIAKPRPKRSTYSDTKKSAKLSIRLYPDQEVAVRQMAEEQDRSLNGAVSLIIDWYLRAVEDGKLLSPQGHSREDALIYKQQAFQFRAAHSVIQRLWDLAARYEYATINPFIVGIVDEYLDAHKTPTPGKK